MLSDTELIEIQAATLFRYDGSGRMLCPNENNSDEPAPRLFLGRTRDRNIWRFRHDLSDSLVRDSERLLRDEPITDRLDRPPTVLSELTAALGEYAPVQSTWMGPAWRFPDEVAAPPGVAAITSANASVLRKHFPWGIEELEHLSPCRAVVIEGDAVSLCFSSRTSREAAEAGVETAEAFRGRGFAPAVVAAWARAVRESNRVPLYSTSWENLASRAVARKLGLVLYGADLSIS